MWTGLFGVISFELNGQRSPVAGRNPVTVTPFRRVRPAPDLFPAEIEQRIRQWSFSERSVVRASG
jgi:hypothetical protein